MKENYRVYKNGQCVAVGRRTFAQSAFIHICKAANPFEDVVLLTDHYRTSIDSF